MKSAERPPQHDNHPLAAAGGAVTIVSSPRDVFEQLDDLMAVIEALCPIWPERALFATEGTWRL